MEVKQQVGLRSLNGYPSIKCKQCSTVSEKDSNEH